MKKAITRKLFSILICIALLLATSTLSLKDVSAAGETYVPEVNFTSVATPVKGSTWNWHHDSFVHNHGDRVTSYASSLGEGVWGYFTSDDGFQLMSGLADQTYVAGTTYSYVVCIKAKSGYYIDENTVVTVNGNTCRYVPTFSSDGHYSFAYDYPVGDPFTFEFNSDGGTGTMSDDTGMEGFAYTLPACTFTAPDGKKFFAWEVDDSGIPQEAGSTFTPTGTGRTIVIKALWQDIPLYLVTYHLQGHGVASDYPAVTDIVEGTFITAPTAPTAEGYEFAGWYEDASCTTAFDHSTTPINQDYNLYAKWVSTSTDDDEDDSIDDDDDDDDSIVDDDNNSNNYTVSGESGSEWTKGNGNGMGFLTNVDLSKINRVTVDGNVVDKKNYSTSAGANGSTKITLSDSYLASLGVGLHTINIVTDNGTASMKFTIKSGNSTDVETGVKDHSELLLILMILSALTIGGITFKRQLRNFR